MEHLVFENYRISHDLVREVLCFYSLAMIFETFRFHFSNKSLIVDNTEYIMSWKYENFGTWGRQWFW